MFVYRSRFLKRGEVWFDNPAEKAPVDWILYRNRSSPVERSRWKYFYNRLIDLSQSAEELLADMEPKTANKIKTAEQERVRCECCDARDKLTFDELERMWNQSTEAQRRWGLLNRDWLGRMIEVNALEVNAARDASGGLLLYAVLFRDRHRAQQLMMVSPRPASLDPATRARTNRASCYLLWNTFLRLKGAGLKHFDFGGWYPGNDDIQLLGANAFKKGFGGEVVREYECEQIVTLRGWLLLTVARMIERSKKHKTVVSPSWEGNTDAAIA